MQAVSNPLQQSPLTQSMQSAEKRKILLLEDEPFWQLIIGDSLRSIDKNISLRCVRDAKHAEQVLFESSSEFDLIIADYYLDGRSSGYDFYKTLRTNHKNTPFMMISGIEEPEFKKIFALSEIEMPIYLPKPFKIENLRNVLRGCT